MTSRCGLKLYNACDTAIGLEFEEAFSANVDQKGKKLDIPIKLRKRLLCINDSDFIRNYQTLNVSVL